jgi:hypothetical protein
MTMKTKPKIIPIALFSLLLGLVFDWMFYGKLPGISVFIYSSLILGFLIYFARLFRERLNISIYWLVPVILFFALMIFILANPLLIFLNIILIIYLLMLVVRLACKPNINIGQYKIVQYISPIIGVPSGILREFIRLLQRIADNRNSIRPKSSLVPTIRGLVLSLPVLFIFLLLFSSADLVFKEYLTSLFDISVDFETIFRWGLIGFVGSWFSSAYALIFMQSSAPTMISDEKNKKFDLGATESSIILGSVSVLFFIFVAVQFAYLFNGSQQIASTGYTFAEYARKGFFELIAVATISLVLIWFIQKFTNFNTLSKVRLFKWLSAIMIVEVMLVMLSANKRLNLYEEAYGFTTLRLMSHLFIFWLAAALVLLMVNILREKNENQFALHVFISVVCFFAIFNLINPDAFIARQNINRFNHSGKLDFYYLNGLSEDATPEIAKLLDHPDERVRKCVANIFYRQKNVWTNQSSHWQSTNLGRQRSKQVFRENSTQIEAGKIYFDCSELTGR